MGRDGLTPKMTACPALKILPGWPLPGEIFEGDLYAWPTHVPPQAGAENSNVAWLSGSLLVWKSFVTLTARLPLSFRVPAAALRTAVTCDDAVFWRASFAFWFACAFLIFFSCAAMAFLAAVAGRGAGIAMLAKSLVNVNEGETDRRWRTTSLVVPYKGCQIQQRAIPIGISVYKPQVGEPQ